MDLKRETIEERRIALGMSRDELGAAAGITSATVWSIERSPGKKVSAVTIAKVARALDDAEAARVSSARGTDPALRTELDALRTEVAELSRLVYELLESDRQHGVDSGKQPGGLQGLQVPPATRRSPA